MHPAAISLLAFMGSYAYCRSVYQLIQHFKLHSQKPQSTRQKSPIQWRIQDFPREGAPTYDFAKVAQLVWCWTYKPVIIPGISVLKPVDGNIAISANFV